MNVPIFTVTACLILAACVPGPGYDSGYYEQRRPPQQHEDARQQTHDHAAREARERHDQRVRELQHEFDKHQITERQFRDGIKQADRELSRSQDA
jgi:hypothetical protein